MQGGQGELIHNALETGTKEVAVGIPQKTQGPAIVQAREPGEVAEPARADKQTAIRRVDAAGKN
jgi:hypothetical protein